VCHSSQVDYEYVSRTAAHAEAHRYEVNSSLMWISSGPLPDLEADVPSALFAIPSRRDQERGRKVNHAKV
jgi:hypothetical protein